MHNPMILNPRALPGQLHVKTTQWRPWIAGRKDCRIQSVSPVVPELIDWHTHQRLHAGHKHVAVLSFVLGLQIVFFWSEHLTHANSSPPGSPFGKGDYLPSCFAPNLGICASR